MILLFTLGLMVSVAALWLAPVHHYALLAMCFLRSDFSSSVRRCSLALPPLSVDTNWRQARLLGFLGVFAYLGTASLARWPLSQVIERYGWSGMFSLLSVPPS